MEDDEMITRIKEYEELKQAVIDFLDDRQKGGYNSNTYIGRLRELVN